MHIEVNIHVTGNIFKELVELGGETEVAEGKQQQKEKKMRKRMKNKRSKMNEVNRGEEEEDGG